MFWYQGSAGLKNVLGNITLKYIFQNFLCKVGIISSLHVWKSSPVPKIFFLRLKNKLDMFPLKYIGLSGFSISSSQFTLVELFEELVQFI